MYEEELLGFCLILFWVLKASRSYAFYGPLGIFCPSHDLPLLMGGTSPPGFPAPEAPEVSPMLVVVEVVQDPSGLVVVTVVVFLSPSVTVTVLTLVPSA